MVVGAQEIDPFFRVSSLGNIIRNIINTIFGSFFLVAFVYLSSHGEAYSVCN
jgi:hypothetical protein